ncbi:hypothetical protein DMN91_011573 [Ooceraea biroi]|uniref:Uncharacterized protein n=1 Tax=Ooceraea biroi TaxID=2015173 RepID=A0A3L8D5Q6_OOCBI|nr:hypothetical protein DMN91_011573 [Ooceraea biroi]
MWKDDARAGTHPLHPVATFCLFTQNVITFNLPHLRRLNFFVQRVRSHILTEVAQETNLWSYEKMLRGTSKREGALLSFVSEHFTFRNSLRELQFPCLPEEHSGQ